MIESVGAAGYLEDSAEQVKWALEERWFFVNRSSEAFDAIEVKQGAGAIKARVKELRREYARRNRLAKIEGRPERMAVFFSKNDLQSQKK